MYHWIIGNEIIETGDDFDALVDKRDAEMEGFVIEAKDWEAK